MVTGTDDLIERLTADLAPVPATAVPRRLLAGVGAGLAVSAALMLAVLGPRPDLAHAVATAPYWIKFAYTLLLGCAALAAMGHLARPGGSAPRSWLAVAALLLMVVLLAAMQLAQAPADQHRALIMGQSADKCPWLIIVLSLPVLAGAIWAMRGLAPTDLPRAGLSVGLAAGGLGAWVYSFHCDETAMPFLALWYTLGIAVVSAAGAFAGRILLRW